MSAISISAIKQLQLVWSIFQMYNTYPIDIFYCIYARDLRLLLRYLFISIHSYEHIDYDLKNILLSLLKTWIDKNVEWEFFPYTKYMAVCSHWSRELKTCLSLYYHDQVVSWYRKERENCGLEKYLVNFAT